jgi:replicative DNA helicase
MPDINEIISLPGSERGILSIILNSRDKILECETKNLYADHFSVPGHKMLYSAICHLYSRPDVGNLDSLVIYNTVTDQAARASIDALGGMTYIDTLIQSNVADNLNIYINHVRTCALKRIAYNMGTDIQNFVLQNNNPDASVEELFDYVQRRTLDLVLQNESQEEVYRMGTSAGERLQRSGGMI